MFGIQDKVICKQINYMLNENELLEKGLNKTLSLVFDGIKQLNKSEKHLKITCDNVSEQNKNNTTFFLIRSKKHLHLPSPNSIKKHLHLPFPNSIKKHLDLPGTTL